MHPRVILHWTAAIVAGVVTAGIFATTNLAGLIPAIAPAYTLPFLVSRWRLERAMQRELRSWLKHG